MVLVLLSIAQFVAVLDGTIVAVALPSVQRDLGFDPATLQWVVTAYTLAFGGLLIPAGRAGDLLRPPAAVRGRAGAVRGRLGGLRASRARRPSWSPLRAVQGGACALFVPAALALLTEVFPAGERRRRAVGIWTAAGAAGGSSGWVLGGLLTEAVGWRAVFAVNVPLAAAGVALANRVLPAGDARAARPPPRGAPPGSTSRARPSSPPASRASCSV